MVAERIADTSAVSHISQIQLGERFGKTLMGELGYFARHPEHKQMQMVEVECHGYPDGRGGRIPCAGKTRFSCMAYFSEVTACDECRTKFLENEAMRGYRKYWESLCPEGFRDTKPEHPDFPKAQLLQLKEWKGEKSLFFLGDSRTGKSRLAMLMLKRCLLLGKYVGVIWPEKLKSTSFAKDTFEMIERLSKYDVLLLDDALLAAANSDKIVSMLKDLADVMIRNKKIWIITSQLNGGDVEEQSKKKGETTRADKASIEALLNRLREESQVISFVKPLVTADTEQF